MREETVVISKSQEFEDYLVAKGILEAGYYERLEKARPDDVMGKVVIGMNIPLYLAANASYVIEIPLFIPVDKRAEKFTVEFFERYAGDPVKYYVHKMR